MAAEAGLIAGDTSLATRVKAELKQWLRSQYAGFLWPFLRRELASIALASGVQRLTFGKGSGGVTEEVQRINDPIRIYTSNYSVRDNVRILTDWGDDTTIDDNIVDPSTNRGQPQRARVVADSALHGKWNVIFDRVADKAYLLELSYFIVPEDPADADVPLYANQRTIIQAGVAFILKYKKSEEYDRELQILVSQVNEDRLKYTQAPGINDTLGLDSRTYR